MSSAPSTSARGVYEKYVSLRRATVLSAWFSKLAPERARILDVGCGDGLLAALLKFKRPDLDLRGIDVLPRDHAHIPVDIFDGIRIPFPDSSFDVVLLSDVLHHTQEPSLLQREAGRVAAEVLIKDHYRKGFAAGARLRFMDWLGNARSGVALPYNYWTERQWHETWKEIGFHPEKIVTRLGLYPAPADWMFGARLHFIARLKKV